MISGIGKQRHQPHEAAIQSTRHQPRPGSIADVGGGDEHHEQQAERIDR